MYLRSKVGNSSGIAVVRRKLGYTQEEFAQELRVPKSTLSMAECRKRDLPFHALVILGEFERELLNRAASEAVVADNTGETNFSAGGGKDMDLADA